MPKITSIAQFSKYFAKLWLGNDPDTYEYLAEKLDQELNQHIEDIIGDGQTTIEIFKKIISKRNAHEELGVTSALVRRYRYKLKNELPVSEESIADILSNAGYTIVQERKWKK